MVLQQMKVMRDDMKVLAEGVVAHAHVQQDEVKGLKKSLEETHKALEGMKENVSQLPNDFMVEFVDHFEEARRQISPLSNLDLSPLDLFKVVLDGELVDEE